MIEELQTKEEKIAIENKLSIWVVSYGMINEISSRAIESAEQLSCREPYLAFDPTKVSPWI